MGHRVCSLCENDNVVHSTYFELRGRFELPTFALQVRCSTVKSYPSVYVLSHTSHCRWSVVHGKSSFTNSNFPFLQCGQTSPTFNCGRCESRTRNPVRGDSLANCFLTFRISSINSITFASSIPSVPLPYQRPLHH